MKLISTAGRSRETVVAEAIFTSLAPDGGLYTPARLEPLPESTLASLPALAPLARRQLLARHLLADEVAPAELDRLVELALDFPWPLVEPEPGVFALELFRGPTLAFKDVGARFLARLMGHFLARRGAAEPLTILVATSGDTGSAVAHAFFGVAGLRVVVLYPRGQVSEAQRKLFTTLQGNVLALEVAGTFDDCQRLVKAAFRNQALRVKRPLASANSINIGRLLPQTLYYFELWSELSTRRDLDPATPLVVSVPSGNFGNLTAGLLAKAMGLPVARFVAATNVNDVVPEYLESGVYEPRASRPTLSNAMDVGDPSNWHRIQHLYGHDLDRLRRDLIGERATDEETISTLRALFERTGYLLDPHSAVGYCALKRTLVRTPGSTGVVLATAHPAKFQETVERAISRSIELPRALADCLGRPEHSQKLPPREEALFEALEER